MSDSFLLAVRRNIRPPGQPCSVGSLIVRLRAENPDLAKGLEAALALPHLEMPSTAIEAVLFNDHQIDMSAQPLNRHRNGRCRHCPSRAVAA